MKKINKEILKEIRDNCMKEYGVSSPLELNLYHHLEFTDEVERVLSNSSISVASTFNLFELDENGETIDDVFDEELVLYHNKGSLPEGITIELLNKISPSHSWIMDSNLYYDAECLEGVEKLFDLPYYKRIFNLTTI